MVSLHSCECKVTILEWYLEHYASMEEAIGKEHTQKKDEITKRCVTTQGEYVMTEVPISQKTASALPFSVLVV